MATTATRIARLERTAALLQRTKDEQPELVVYDPATGPPPASDPRRARVLIPTNGREPTKPGTTDRR